LSYKGHIKIGIIGGNGRMGIWFRTLFETKGHEYLISDRGTELSNIDIARSCNVIIVATPMEVFEDVIKEIAPHIHEDAFLTDICSLKST
jgi:prephenate dehydrogenase